MRVLVSLQVLLKRARGVVTALANQLAQINLKSVLKLR